MLSAQSLREYYSNMLRLDRRANAVQALRAEIEVLEALIPEALRIDPLTEAWALQDRYQLSFWEALLVASALNAGCGLFLSEDLNSGQKIETLVVVNPFTTTPDAALSG